MTIWPFDFSPVDPFSTDTGVVEAYGILAMAFVLAFPKRPVFAMIWPVACAIADEVLPAVAHSQHFNVADSLWKALGIAVGVTIGQVWNLRFRQFGV